MEKGSRRGADKRNGMYHSSLETSLKVGFAYGSVASLDRLSGPLSRTTFFDFREKVGFNFLNVSRHFHEFTASRKRHPFYLIKLSPSVSFVLQLAHLLRKFAAICAQRRPGETRPQGTSPCLRDALRKHLAMMPTISMSSSRRLQVCALHGILHALRL